MDSGESSQNDALTRPSTCAAGFSREVGHVGIESCRRSENRDDREPQFEWFGDRLEPTLLLRQRLSCRLGMVASLQRHLGEGVPNLGAVNSDLHADDDALKPFHVSHLVGHSIGMALDALGTLELILRDRRAAFASLCLGCTRLPGRRSRRRRSACGL